MSNKIFITTNLFPEISPQHAVLLPVHLPIYPGFGVCLFVSESFMTSHKLSLVLSKEIGKQLNKWLDGVVCKETSLFICSGILLLGYFFFLSLQVQQTYQYFPGFLPTYLNNSLWLGELFMTFACSFFGYCLVPTFHLLL